MSASDTKPRRFHIAATYATPAGRQGRMQWTMVSTWPTITADAEQYITKHRKVAGKLDMQIHLFEPAVAIYDPATYGLDQQGNDEMTNRYQTAKLTKLQRIVEEVVLASFILDENDELTELHARLCDEVGLNMYQVLKQK